MKASEGKLGRIYMVRLEEGDSPQREIERFAAERGVQAAQVFVVGESAMAGIIAPDGDGVPRLRLSSMGSTGESSWTDCEVMIQEVVGIAFKRVVDPKSGRDTLARVSRTRTRVMRNPAPAPEGEGPGTVPVYLFNAEFN